MQPIFTKEEQVELQKLLQIIKDERRLSGQRRIAIAKFDRIYEEAVKRTASQNRLVYA